MSNRIKNNLKNLVGQTLNQYYSKVKPTISDLRYKQEYQNRIIECMVGEVDDNYITTPETDNPIVKLEHSKEGLVKVPTVKGKTILVDAEGNETDTPAEGCKLLSVGEQEDNKLIILSKNKNLLDISTFKNIDINIRDIIGLDIREERGYSSSHRILTIVKVKPNTKYTFSVENANESFQAFIGFADKNYIGIKNELVWAKLNDFKYYSFITTSDTQFLYINAHNNYNIILEEGSMNYYVEPKYYKTEILLSEPLRSLPNGVCDEIVGNKIIRRVGKFILNGNNHWGEMTNNRFILVDKSIKPNVGDGKLITCMCNMYEPVGRGTLDNYSKNGIGTVYTGGIMIVDKNVQSLSDFKEKMNKNPITVFCELIEPIIEELPNGITLQGYDDTTMYIENSITPTVSYGYNALIPYKEELSLQKEEVETNTLDIENNIIPYLMDMEFNLMLMEDK